VAESEFGLLRKYIVVSIKYLDRMHNFRELKVWKMGIEISKLIFQLTRSFPAEERYSLTSQLTRCAVSVPSNIAEGCGRNLLKN